MNYRLDMDIQDRKEIIDNISFLAQKQDIPKLKNIIIDIHPADLADIMRELDDTERDLLFSLLDPETASDVVVELDEVTRDHLIQDMEEKRLTEIVDEMDSNDATDVVADLPDELAQKVLSQIDSKDRAEVEKLIVHDEETAGGIMAMEFVAVQEDQTVDDAIQEIRQKAQEVEDVYNVYAIDRDGKLVGVVSLKKLLLSNPRMHIHDIMNTDVISVTVEEDQEHVANIVRKYDLVSVPVVDNQNRLVGRITVDDIVDVLQEEATEDLQRMAGIVDEEVLQETSALRISRFRLPWLLVAFVGENISALVMHHFQATINQILAMAFFIPLIMAMGGNSGSQSAMIVVRSIALAEGGTSNTLERILRELRVALLNGIIIGLLLFGITQFWMNDPFFGLLIAFALLFVIVNAAILGSLVPYILNRLHFDPAIATGPFISTANDVLGLFIYLGLATIYMNWAH
ncbi:MAG: magnesium transporter [Calditrichaeota bacterium]|nr:magnesium transporter [Calditrichota bacterium]